jgi:hypothetical protein
MRGNNKGGDAIMKKVENLSNDFVYITLRLPKGTAEWLETCAKANAMEPSHLAAYIFEIYRTIWNIAVRVTINELNEKKLMVKQ